jgi:hypothetical protein
VVAAIGLQQPQNRAVREPPPNLHQLVANTPLAVLGARPTAFFQCSLRFADGAKSQLLISHCCLPKMARWASRWKNQVGIEVIQSIFVSIPGSKCGTNVSQPSECGHDCLRAAIRSSSTRFRSGGRSRHRVLGTAEHRGQLPGGSVAKGLGRQANHKGIIIKSLAFGDHCASADYASAKRSTIISKMATSCGRRQRSKSTATKSKRWRAANICVVHSSRMDRSHSHCRSHMRSFSHQTYTTIVNSYI